MFAGQLLFPRTINQINDARHIVRLFKTESRPRIVERDAVAQSTRTIPVNATDDESVMLCLLDANYIESDSFNLFCSVMQVARSFYEYTDDKPVNGQAEMAPIVARSQFIHNELLVTADQELATHLNAIEILPQIFLTYVLF